MNTVDSKLKIINRCPLAKGKKELIKYLKGGVLTLKESALAHCYECMGYYIDGKRDCMMALCPHYPFMPYSPRRRKLRKEAKDVVNNLKGRERRIAG